MKIHCFFEQSGTFKNEFKKLGFNAEDYDVLNQFNETDNSLICLRKLRNLMSECHLFLTR